MSKEAPERNLGDQFGDKEQLILDDRGGVEGEDIINEQDIAKAVTDIDQKLDDAKSIFDGPHFDKLQGKRDKLVSRQSAKLAKRVNGVEEKDIQSLTLLADETLEKLSELSTDLEDTIQTLTPFFENRDDLQTVLTIREYKRNSGYHEYLGAQLLSAANVDKENIKGIQAYLKIKVDGKVGPVTINALSKMLDLKDVSVKFGNKNIVAGGDEVNDDGSAVKEVNADGSPVKEDEPKAKEDGPKAKEDTETDRSDLIQDAVTQLQWIFMRAKFQGLPEKIFSEVLINPQVVGDNIVINTGQNNIYTSAITPSAGRGYIDSLVAEARTFVKSNVYGFGHINTEAGLRIKYRGTLELTEYKFDTSGQNVKARPSKTNKDGLVLDVYDQSSDPRTVIGSVKIDQSGCSIVSQTPNHVEGFHD